MFEINRYLILKRRNFPRLYFMTNDELMEMVGNSGDEFALQKNLFLLFPGIKKLKFAEKRKNKEIAVKKSLAFRAKTLAPKLTLQQNKKSNVPTDAKPIHDPLKEERERRLQLLPQIIGLENEQGE